MKRKERITVSFNTAEIDEISRIQFSYYLCEKLTKAREKLIAKIKASRGKK